MPGRKTGMNDSHWIAQLHRFGLIKPSFIPEDELHRMRLLSRHRTNLTEGRVNCFLIKQLMGQFYYLRDQILILENELVGLVQPYGHLIDKLKEIPGVDQILAIGIVAEAGVDMTRFPDERKFAAWAGVASGNNESVGKKKIKNSQRQSTSEENFSSSSQCGQAETKFFLPSQVQ